MSYVMWNNLKCLDEKIAMKTSFITVFIDYLYYLLVVNLASLISTSTTLPCLTKHVTPKPFLLIYRRTGLYLFYLYHL